MKTGLSALISPLTLNEFFDRFNQNESFVVHHEESSLRPLRDLPFLASLKTLLQSWPKEIHAHLPDVRDEASSIETNTKDAQKLFDNGMGLLFNEAQSLSPLLLQWLEHIRQDLGISALSYARCLIYATPKNKGTAPHFDQNINFVLQVHGEKTWHMAKNESVVNPMTRHTLGLPTDPELASYTLREFPAQMPNPVQTFVLKPGSVLFVPRGCWHSTEAQQDALSLNFTFTAPTWLDLFTAALRSRLALSADWRETATGLVSPHQRESAQLKMDLLLESLVEDLPYWRAADILRSTEPDSEN